MSVQWLATQHLPHFADNDRFGQSTLPHLHTEQGEWPQLSSYSKHHFRQSGEIGFDEDSDMRIGVPHVLATQYLRTKGQPSVP
jgi:hypothetical protein